VAWSQVRFDSLAEEVNFIALLSMLSVGGGLRAELHKAIDAGAHSTIMRGVLGIYLSVRAPLAEMAGIRRAQVPCLGHAIVVDRRSTHRLRAECASPAGRAARPSTASHHPGAAREEAQGSKLDADFLADFDVGLCSQYFGIPTHHEVPAEGLQGFATVSQPVRNARQR